MKEIHKIFITGIGTEVGKTIVSAIFAQALKADYWKPIQCGDLQNSDTKKVSSMIQNEKSRFHPETYRLHHPLSPHAAARLENITLKKEKIQAPSTSNHLIIEGAGGLLVPLSERYTIADLIQTDYKVILVSRHYLGSINHTLLSLNYLKEINIAKIGLIFNGKAQSSTENIIREHCKFPLIGRLNEEDYLNITIIKNYANIWQKTILKWLENQS
ncbi:dethiobiotin synthase [Bacteroidetes bacterium endosymbiont of Geopemphigus sp.]|uniref:dethiobiotin synthase n=1 Tax=Bacteroidetes bacterium endosymbiont of Geopemphigus sp. TaxID=2047937 RepID=UPI000CCFDBAD|nr:dethiobiotin synthase [Bacteroidetes bacterium endosymbiont of Geopemphigus sp.]